MVNVSVAQHPPEVGSSISGVITGSCSPSFNILASILSMLKISCRTDHTHFTEFASRNGNHFEDLLPLCIQLAADNRIILLCEVSTVVVCISSIEDRLFIFICFTFCLLHSETTYSQMTLPRRLSGILPDRSLALLDHRISAVVRVRLLACKSSFLLLYRYF